MSAMTNASTMTIDNDGSAAIARLAAQAQGGRAPLPVEHWSPPDCGPVDLAIAFDGTWLHEGRPIVRPQMLKLFAAALHKDADGITWLVTPQEKCRVAVADAPFLAVEMARAGHGGEQILVFRTNLDDLVTAGPAHPIRFVVDEETGGIRPYLRVRGRLEARLTRSTALDLLDLIESDETGRFGIWSGDAFFPLPREAQM